MKNLSNSKPEYTTGGSGQRSAQRDGGSLGNWAKQDVDRSGGSKAKSVESKPEHTTGGSSLGAWRTAGQGRVGLGANRIVAQETRVPRTLQGIEDTSPERFSRSRNKRNPMETDGGTKPAVDNRFITRTRSALSSWLLTSGPTLFCLCKPFSCKACPGTSLWPSSVL